MRRFAVIVSMLIALAWLIPHARVAAAPTDVTRSPDGELHFCLEGAKCVARAVADFNGDKKDDVLFEVSTMGVPTANAATARRRFELHLAPWSAIAGSRNPGDRQPAGRVVFVLDSAQAVDPVVAADVDGDGLADLVFAQAVSDVEFADPVGRLLVVRGRRSWASAYNLNDLTKVDLRIQRSFPGTQIGLLSLAAADLNGDKQPDLAVGVDVQKVPDPDNSRSQGTPVRVSSVGIYWGKGKWPALLDAPPDVAISGLGGCSQGLAGLGDVTGDGLADVVVRRCVAEVQPTQLRVLPGRSNWPRELTAENSPAIPRPMPTQGPGAEPTAEPTIEAIGGGGYLPSLPLLEVKLPEHVELLDVNGDGVADLGLEFAGKTHLFYGGPGLVERAAKNRSSAIILKGGYGALQLTHSWRRPDLTGDGKPDLVLSRPVDPAFLACPDGSCRRTPLQRPPTGKPIFVYSSGQGARRVLDMDLDAPDGLWSDPGDVIWGMGDFNGDGKADLLLGSSPGAFDSVYALVYGPLALGQ